jgi:hypothetical protein
MLSGEEVEIGLADRLRGILEPQSPGLLPVDADEAIDTI